MWCRSYEVRRTLDANVSDASRVSGDEDKMLSLGCITIFPSRITLQSTINKHIFPLPSRNFQQSQLFKTSGYPQVSSRVCIPGRVSPVKSLVELGKVEAFCSSSLPGGRPFTSSLFLSPKSILCASGYRVHPSTATSALLYPVLAHLQAGYSTKVWAL